MRAMVIQRWMDKQAHIKRHRSAPTPREPPTPKPTAKPVAKADTAARNGSQGKASRGGKTTKPTADNTARNGSQGNKASRGGGKTTKPIATLKETKSLHQKMKSTMASAADILSEINANEEWVKIRHLTDATDRARKSVEAWRAQSGFWRQWTVCRDISTLTVDVADDALAQELRRAPELDALLDALADAVADLSDHQTIEQRRKRS